MGYEVMYDITLLASLLDPKEKRTDTYLERVTSVEEPSIKKGKVVPSVSAPVTSASPKVTKRSPTKKKLEVAPAKVFERKQKTKGNTPDSEDTESKEQPKKTRQTRKKTKTTSNEPTSSASVNIDISSYKPLTHCQRTIKNIRRKVLSDLVECFDDFNDNEKEEVEQEVIQYLCINDRSP